MKWLSAGRLVRGAAAGVCLIASVATSAARAEETFVVALSPGVEAAFGDDIRVTLSVMGTLHDDRYSLYRGGAVDLLSALYDGFPTPGFDVLITSDSELSRPPIATLHVEDGRRLRPAFSFILLAGQRKAMARFQSSKVAHPSHGSFRRFFSEVLLGCMFGGTGDGIRPISVWKEGKIFERTPPDVDVLVLQSMEEGKRIIGYKLLVRLMNNQWSSPRFIPFYQSPTQEEIKKFGDCLDATSGGKYNFTNRSDTGRLQRSLGIIIENTSIQTVETNETIKIVVPESVWSDKKFGKNFFLDMYAGLEHLKLIARQHPSDVIIQSKFEQYARGYELLTSSLRGTIEIADIRFAEAADRWDVVETLQPIGKITAQFEDGKPLQPQVIAAIDDAISAYDRGFEKMEELPRERITLRSMRARVTLIQLHYFKHQHALLTNDQETSCRELDIAQKLIVALKVQVKTVKNVDDFNYKRIRYMERFTFIEDHYLANPLHEIAEIEACDTSSGP